MTVTINVIVALEISKPKRQLEPLSSSHSEALSVVSTVAIRERRAALNAAVSLP